MGVSDDGISGSREFPPTSWSVILHARDPASPAYTRYLRRLVELYWRPVYCVVRHASRTSHDDAKDLTQEFFATVVFDRELLIKYVPERGSFRTLLRAALTSFMRDVARASTRQKRGAGAVNVPIDFDRIALPAVPGADAMTPDRLFDVAWNQAVMAQAMSLVERRLRAEGKPLAFEVFRRYDVEGDSVNLSQGDLGKAMGLTARQVRLALGDARATFRQIVTDIVRGYVDDADDLAAELRAVFGA